MSLLAPITMKSVETSVPEFVSEHEKIILGVKNLYGISESERGPEEL